MKIDWRVSAIAAGGAFLLSALVGVIGNVSFGALVVRAILIAVVFGAGAIGMTFVIDRYLPELRAAPPPETASETGNSVDIVVDGDDGLISDSSGTADLSASELEDMDDEERAEMDDMTVDFADSDESVEAADEDDVHGSVDDDLPDVESMGDSFTEVPLAEETIEDVNDSAGDPASMARAIRTVLKREE